MAKSGEGFKKYKLVFMEIESIDSIRNTANIIITV